MRNHTLSLLFCLLCCPIALAATTQGDFYVAPGGNDSASGKSDAPFATFQRAQEAVRELRRASPDRERPVTVLFRAGTYELARPILITPAESGTARSPTIYSAYGDEAVTFSGGRRLSGWKVEQGRWTLQLPEKDWAFVQLFVNGERRFRPRLPKEGYYRIAEEMTPSPKAENKGYDRFKFAGSEVRADWHDLNRVEVMAFQVWTMARLPIESVDESAKVVNLMGRTRGTAHYSKLPKNGRYFLENVKEAMVPGTFYLDRKTGVLTYMPKAGEEPGKTEVFAPRLESLVEIKGDVAGKQPVRHVELRGLSFAHTNWVTPEQGNAYPQAEINVPGAVTVVAAQDCVLEKCKVSAIGHYGIDIGGACQRIRVEGCELTDLGAGGIKIGTTRAGRTGSIDAGTAGSDLPEVTSQITVRDNLIAHGGRLHPAAVGVWIGQSPNNTIEHNEIFDFYYTGISMGWTWGYGPALGQKNTIAYNHIHSIGQRVLSDMGGIYTLGNAEGSVLDHNLIHDVFAYDYGGWGIYPDEGTTHLLIENNVVYDTKTGSFHQHYGKENMIRNNIWAYSQQWQLQRTREEEHSSFTFERNIVLWKTGPLLGSNWKNNHFKLDYNLYWQEGNPEPKFNGMSFAEWKAKTGQDAHSIIADPRFVDAEKRDFRLKDDSPAKQIGFKPIDISKAGRLTRSGKKLEKAPAAFPIPEEK